MKQIHNIQISVFVKQEEDYDKIKETFLSLFPFDIIELKLLKEETAIGFGETKIKILKVNLKKQSQIKDCFGELKSKLNNEQKELLIRQAESRMDDSLHFYTRLDKERLVNEEDEEKKYFITDSGNCFHIKASIAAFPAKREEGIRVVKELFE